MDSIIKQSYSTARIIAFVLFFLTRFAYGQWTDINNRLFMTTASDSIGIGIDTPLLNKANIAGSVGIGGLYSTSASDNIIGKLKAPTYGLLVQGITNIGFNNSSLTPTSNILNIACGSNGSGQGTRSFSGGVSIATASAFASGSPFVPEAHGNGLYVQGPTMFGTYIDPQTWHHAVLTATSDGYGFGPNMSYGIYSKMSPGTSTVHKRVTAGYFYAKDASHSDLAIHADNGSILANGYGQVPTDGSGNELGAGTRLMWIPGTSSGNNVGAFRAGTAGATTWSAANIGNYSFAGGYVNMASGESSTSFGKNNTSSGTASFTVGQDNTASGNSAFTAGRNLTAGGQDIALGSGASSNGYTGCFIFGDASTGWNTTANYYKNDNNNQFKARAASGFVFGNHAAGSPSALNTTYIVPTGPSGEMYVGIGTSSPSSKLHINGDVQLDAISPPSIATNKLYNIGGTLYWNGSPVGGGGGTTYNFLVGLTNIAGNVTNNLITGFGGGQTVVGGTNPSENLTLQSTNSATKGYILLNPNGGDIGINTSSPLAKLHVEEGALLFNGTNGSTPTSGSGTRMMWIPDMAAFRAGSVTGTQWDSWNIGLSSFASGENNRATGRASASTGMNNYVTGMASSAFGYGNTVNGSFSLGVGNGSEANGRASIAMGEYNEASADYSVAIGDNSLASGEGSVALGHLATASGFRSLAGNMSTASGSSSVALGNNTLAAGNYSFAFGYGSVTGGAWFANGSYSIALGNYAVSQGDNAYTIGKYVTADGNNSFAAGSYVNTNMKTGSFIFGDASTTTNTSSTANNQMSMRFAGGYRLYSNSAATVGVVLPAGGTGWSVISDRRKKQGFKDEDGEVVLQKILELPIQSWNCIAQDASIRHIGVCAQDFYEAFGFGETDSMISTVDADGINMLAVQALTKRTEELKGTKDKVEKQSELIGELTKQLNTTNQQLLALQEQLNKMEVRMQSLCTMPCNETGSTPTVEPKKVTLDGGKEAVLFQNEPNPFTATTVIKYYLPENAGAAYISITNVLGNTELARINVTGKGLGQVEVNAGTLAAGTYFYTLIVNDKQVDTKKMVLIGN